MGGRGGGRWERVTTMFHSYSPQRPLSLRLFVSLMLGGGEGTEIRSPQRADDTKTYRLAPHDREAETQLVQKA